MAFSKEKAHERAEKFAAKGQHDKAAREYQSIVDNDPKDIRAWLMLADCLARTGDRGAALQRYLQVADYYAGAKEHQKALAVYRQALNIDPNRLDVHYKCAQLNMEIGRVHDAIASFEQIAAVQLQTGHVSEALKTYRVIADADAKPIDQLPAEPSADSAQEQRTEFEQEESVAGSRLREIAAHQPDEGECHDDHNVGRSVQKPDTFRARAAGNRQPVNQSEDRRQQPADDTGPDVPVGQ